MRAAFDINRIDAGHIIAWLIPLIGFWVVLAFEIPYSISQYFRQFIPVLFLGILLLFYLSFRLKKSLSVLAVFGLVMLLFALSLSFLWTSGVSDNFLIGGLLPYKDAKNYYQGATQILNGLPVRLAVNAVRRPLFSGFFSSLLLLSGQNLKLTLEVTVQLAGLGLFLSARQVRQGMGAWAAALYIVFMYYYFYLAAGYVMSETLGFIGGCLGFALLWRAAQDRKWFDLLLGLVLTLVAVSARAGAFFIFPLLVFWAGWAFRGEKLFSIRVFILVLAVLVIGYFFLNTVYPSLLGVPEDSSFGNFAYSLYGQVRGGIGWHSAIDELGTSNPSAVYQAAWEVFLADPAGFTRGAAKSYADFFLPGIWSIFPFGEGSLDWILWFLTVAVLLRGMYLLIRNLRSETSILLLAGFVGIILSIPFLPPIDGGNRFYASTMPFFFVPFAVGIGRFPPDPVPAPANHGLFLLRFVSVSLLALTALLPPVTLRLRSRPLLNAPACSPEQRPFAIRVNPGSYIDIVPVEHAPCGLAPEICLDDYRNHHTEISIDDFYQELDALVSSSPSETRIIPTLNLLDGFFQYFVATDRQVFANSPGNLFSGCAVRIETENQRIFLIESILPSNE
jgi:hypothetical protein